MVIIITILIIIMNYFDFLYNKGEDEKNKKTKFLAHNNTKI